MSRAFEAAPPGRPVNVLLELGIRGGRAGCRTAFDKWCLIFVVDEDYRVVDAVRTFF